MSGEHAELFTYHLNVGLLSDKRERGELAPFSQLVYKTTITDSEEPHSRLIFRSDDGSIVLEVFNKNGAYELKLFNPEGDLPAKLMAVLTGNPAFKAEMDGSMSRAVDREKIGQKIDEVVSVVREF